MRLHSTRRHWNWFARKDPLWAVLTEPDKAEGRWRIEEFFATGRAAILAELKWIGESELPLRRGRALDFGCGVGRLTQALAEHFEQVDAIDIAEDMLKLAARYNRHAGRVRLIHNTRADLQLLPDSHYDYVLSDITLQHIAPKYARRYVSEFVRVLAPGGVLSFQVPSYVPPPVLEKFKFSWWPPTLWTRICRFTRRRWETIVPPEPVMEVHAIPRSEVHTLVESAGGRIVAERSNDAAGTHIESYRYLVTKP
jgi:SAM-dependent methyltransferase